ncbi:hypothetical protein LIER_21613 [Lithospermum erythrorhizon]|uniref:Uncharacterized protein n=1 Tax=Lithospermum erythrorhizon TaxID=34254 RepID=A0AAV3QQZ7_LITER
MHGGINGSDMEGATTMLQTLLKIDDCKSGDDSNIQIDDPSHRQKGAPGIGKPTLSISESFREMLHSAGKFNGRKDSVGNQVMDKLRISSTILKLRKTSNGNTPVSSAISRDIDGSRNQTCSEFSPWDPNRKSCGRKVPKEEANTMELCKKRIMMGRRCRSLNLSGSLQYDENGILLPEELIPAGDV